MAKVVAMDDIELTIAYEETHEGQVIARIVEVPAATSFGSTRQQAREAALDALRELALSYLERPDATPAGEGAEVVRIHAALG